MSRISTILLFIALAFIFWMASSGVAVWDGAVHRTLHIQVVRDDGRTPASGLRVLILRWESFASLSHADQLAFFKNAEIINSDQLTDTGGQVTLRAMLGAGGAKTLFHNSGHFVVSGHLGIFHDTTLLAEFDLQKLVPKERYELKEELPVIRVSLPKP